MNAKDAILSRALPKQYEIILEVDGAGEIKFLVPLSGVEQAKFQKRLDAFVNGKPNGNFVAKGLMPMDGFSEGVASCLFVLMEWNQEGWSQEDVLAMFDANPDEILAIASKVGELSAKAKDEAKAKQLDTELKN